MPARAAAWRARERIVVFCGNFDWRRHFYRVGILLRSFFGRWNNGPSESLGPILNTPLRLKVEG